MQLGIVNHGWWNAACAALGFKATTLPAPAAPGGSVHAAGVAERLACGRAMADVVAASPVNLILDNAGAGLALLPGDHGPNDYKLAHEVFGVPLYSHFIDPAATLFSGLNWPVALTCLMSPTWHKGVWDRTHANELAAFGVPNVSHLPMAAPNRDYRTDPLDLKRIEPIVSFVGGQNSSYFSANTNVATGDLLPGALAHAVRSDLSGASFYDIYHDFYRLAEPALPTDPLDVRVRKTGAYFSAKLFFHAQLNIRNRDRFVIFLSRKLAGLFRLIGRGWDRVYGLPTAPPLPGGDAFFDHFRRSLINVNLVSGNAETGLNMRHFEITAAGGFMLCYNQPELADHFEIGKECDVFHDERELLEQIRFYLANPQRTAEIALAGQQRTLSNHLYSHRLQKILNIADRHIPPYSTTAWPQDFRAAVPEPDVILDCGANVGQTAGSYRREYPNAEIYCFEPASAAFAKLERKCAELGAHAVRKAIGERDGTATMHLTAGPESSPLLAFQPGNPCEKWTRVVGEEQVEVCTLDRWAKEAGVDPARVSIIKLDLQGGELAALRGARGLLRHARLVQVEVSFVPLYKDAPLFDEIDAFMTEQGYRRRAVYPSDQPQNWGDALYERITNYELRITKDASADGRVLDSAKGASAPREAEVLQ